MNGIAHACLSGGMASAAANCGSLHQWNCRCHAPFSLGRIVALRQLASRVDLCLQLGPDATLHAVAQLQGQAAAGQWLEVLGRWRLQCTSAGHGHRLLHGLIGSLRQATAVAGGAPAVHSCRGHGLDQQHWAGPAPCHVSLQSGLQTYGSEGAARPALCRWQCGECRGHEDSCHFPWAVQS
jgi:hypothetical protein